jgi:hypothetical protein
LGFGRVGWWWSTFWLAIFQTVGLIDHTSHIFPSSWSPYCLRLLFHSVFPLLPPRPLLHLPFPGSYLLIIPARPADTKKKAGNFLTRRTPVSLSSIDSSNSNSTIGIPSNMHKHPNGFQNTRPFAAPSSSPLSPEAFFSFVELPQGKDDGKKKKRLAFSLDDEDNDDSCWGINDCTNRSVILSRYHEQEPDYDDNWLTILTANDDRQSPAKRVSLDSSDAWCGGQRDTMMTMDLDDLSFLDRDYGGSGMDVYGGDNDSDSLSMDEDEDETTHEEYTHRRWLEHRQRLDLCMIKSQESRQRILAEHFSSCGASCSTTTTMTMMQSHPHPPTVFARTQRSMIAVRDQIIVGSTTTTAAADVGAGIQNNK